MGSEANAVLCYSADEAVAGLVGSTLEAVGWRSIRAVDLPEAESILRHEPIVAIVADVLHASHSAGSILAHLTLGEVPIVMITRGDSEHIGRCLELGAVDCVGWPVSRRELLARIRLRAEAPPPHGSPEVGRIELDPVERTVRIDGRTASLTDREYVLLSFLAASPGRTFTADQLLKAVWQSQREWQSIYTVAEHVYRIRQKVERDPSHPQVLVTTRGRGYRLTVEQAQIELMNR